MSDGLGLGCENGLVLTAEQLDRFDTDGFVLVPDVLSADEVEILRKGVFENFPTPHDYFADPATFAHLTDTPFAGLVNFPWVSPELNRLVAHPRIVSIVRQILGLARDLDRASVVGLGVGIPGRVDAGARRVLSGGFVDLSGVSLAESAESALDKPVVLDTDCNSNMSNADL